MKQSLTGNQDSGIETALMSNAKHAGTDRLNGKRVHGLSVKSRKMRPLAEEFEFMKKTGRSASFGMTNGKYPFFTSSQEISKWTDMPDLEGPALIFGTGGKASVHYVEGAFSTTNDCYAVIPKNRCLEQAKFSFYFLAHNIHLIESGFRGAGLKHVSKKHLEAILLPIRNPAEYARVNSILDKAGGIRQKCKLIPQLANDFLRSAFLEMFVDPNSNPERYHIDDISQHFSTERSGTQSGPFGAALKKHEYVEKGVPVWGIDNIQYNKFLPEPKLFISNEKYEQLERYQVQSGDVLISRAGTVGRMCIAKPKVNKSIISTNLVRVVLNETTMLPDYFVSLFTFAPHRIGSLKTNKKDKAFTFLNPKTLKNLKIPVPPIDLQLKYRHLSEKLVDFVDGTEKQSQGYGDLYSSLAHRMFHGDH